MLIASPLHLDDASHAEPTGRLSAVFFVLWSMMNTELRDTSEFTFFPLSIEDIPFHYLLRCHLARIFFTPVDRLSYGFDRRSAKSLFRYAEKCFLCRWDLYSDPSTTHFSRCSVMWFAHHDGPSNLCWVSNASRYVSASRRGFSFASFTDKHASALLFASLNGRLWMECLYGYLPR